METTRNVVAENIFGKTYKNSLRTAGKFLKLIKNKIKLAIYLGALSQIRRFIKIIKFIGIFEIIFI